MFRSLLLAFVLGVLGAILGEALASNSKINFAPGGVGYLVPYLLASAPGIVGAVAGAAWAVLEAIGRHGLPPAPDRALNQTLPGRGHNQGSPP